MTILMLLNAPYPADIRVKKEAQALVAAGFDVRLLCLRKKGERYTGWVDGLAVHRIDGGKSNYVLAFWDVVLSLFFFHPLFFRAARKILQSNPAHALHVHDLPLAGTALALKKKFPAVRVVVDFHENYPDALRTWFLWKRNPVARIKNFLFLNPDRWVRHERAACHHADHIIAVVNEMKDRLVLQYGMPPDRITVVTNSEDRSFVLQPKDPHVYRDLAGKFIVAYSGGIGPHRGVDTVIRGMAYLRNHPIHLVVVGSGSPDAMRRLANLVREHELTSVAFWGHQPFHRFYSIMHHAGVNVIPHHANDHTNHTVPHKLYQAMLAARPLLVSSAAPLRRIVEQTQSGLVFEAGNATDFAEKMLALYTNPDLCQVLGANGWKAAGTGTHNWEHDQQELIALYRNR